MRARLAVFLLIFGAAAPAAAQPLTECQAQRLPEPMRTLRALRGRTAARALVPSTGTHEIGDRDVFEALSRRDNVPGAMGVREVKFLMTGVDTPNPVLWFVNTKNFEFHYFFARDALGLPLSNREFNARTYFTDRRQFLAGSIIAHDAYENDDGSQGLYTVEFWPTDPVKLPHVKMAFDAVKVGMGFAADSLRYHPAGQTQQALYDARRADFAARGVDVIETEDLFANVTYSPLNLGEGYGVLRIMDGNDDRPPSVRDVVVFKSIPNDLSHVSGVITDLPQTPLSHINLKAKQNDTPNAFIKNASDRAEVRALEGKIVHYQVTPDGFVLEEATQAEADDYFESIRPTQPQRPARDLTVTSVTALNDTGHAGVSAFGAKAANVAELRKILPEGVVPDGFAVPFSFYDRFMSAPRNADGSISSDRSRPSFYDEVTEMMAADDFQADPAVREERLGDLQDRIEDAEVPGEISDALDYWHHLMQPRAFDRNGDELPVLERPVIQPLRARSSTNNEDLEGFNGAGLYDSYTHRPDEGHFEHSVKQVWASLWNYRAFEEREFYRIDHLQAAMGVLVHPNFDDEMANGVAVTKNIYDPNWPGMYVNVQVGESLVTNPDPGATPDEYLIARLGPNREYEIQYVQHSSLLPDGQKTVLNEAQVAQLTRYMERIQDHFSRVYGRARDAEFAMDIEFKITADGNLAIKQARPWVD